MVTFDGKSDKSPKKNRFSFEWLHYKEKGDLDSLTHFYFPFILIAKAKIPTFQNPNTEIKAWSLLYVACSFFLE